MGYSRASSLLLCRALNTWSFGVRSRYSGEKGTDNPVRIIPRCRSPSQRIQPHPEGDREGFALSRGARREELCTAQPRPLVRRGGRRSRRARIHRPGPDVQSRSTRAPVQGCRAAGRGVPGAAGARMCCNKELSASWTLEGTFEQDQLSPGQQFDIEGQVAVLTDSTSPPPFSNMEFRVFLIADADGRQVGR